MRIYLWLHFSISYMKKVLIGLLMFISALSCSDIDGFSSYDKEVTGELIVNIGDGLPVSKGEETFEYESILRTVQILLFQKSDGKLYSYSWFNPDAETYSVSLPVSVGEYVLWVVANVPSCGNVKSLAELESFPVFLYNNGPFFQMKGHMNVEVLPDVSVTANIQLERLVSRVYVRNITNSCPEKCGDIIIKGIFLSNVVANQNLAGTAEPTLWFNQNGCSSGTEGDVIDGVNYIADASHITWKSLDQTIGLNQTVNVGACVYGFPNTETLVSYDFPFSPRVTCLVIVVSVYNPDTEVVELNQYSVELTKNLLYNNSYSVDVEIIGFISCPNRNSFEVTSTNYLGYNNIDLGDYELN